MMVNGSFYIFKHRIVNSFKNYLTKTNVITVILHLTPMHQGHLINDIINHFEELNKRNDAQTKSIINTIARLCGRIKLDDKTNQLQLSTLVTYIKSAETSESTFYKMNNPTSKETRYSQSFYDSVNVLKKDLLSLLNITHDK